ncbi:MAG: hypothetical protein LiPW15_296 [Parcubacteria group bacterium LiPW_15]|nr:MAG: hypothetical protein LiPW15_296 [Parcubacteria group bacterium LiPW_15]
MVKNNYGNYESWMFPGGGIKKGETPAQAAKREVEEEVGIEVEDLKEIGVFHSAKEFKNDTVTVFAGRSRGKEINIESNEIADARWLELNNLPEISEYSKLMIDMLRRKET